MTCCIAPTFRRYWRQRPVFAASVAALLAAVCLGEEAPKARGTSGGGTVNSMESTGYAEFKIKAAVLIRLTPFFRWPGLENADTNSPTRIGVLGKNPFGEYLNEQSRKTTKSGHPVQIVYGSKPDQLKECQVIFIAQEPAPNWDEIRKAWAGKPVLLVGDQANFIEQGGMVNLLTRQQMPFLQIKRQAIEAAGLKVTGKLDNPNRIEWIP